MSTFLYILALQDDCYYVGRSKNVSYRIKAEFQGHGSYWTQLHRPIHVIKQFPCSCNQEEDMWTKKLMKQFSIDQVRGGSYSKPTLTNEEINLLEKEIRHNRDQCFECGSSNHYIRDCPLRQSDYQWSHLFYKDSFEQKFKNPAKIKQYDETRNVRNKMLISEERRKMYLQEEYEQSQSYYNPKKFKKYWKKKKQTAELYWNQLNDGFEERELEKSESSSSSSQDELEVREAHEIMEKDQEQAEQLEKFSSDFIANQYNEPSESQSEFIDDRSQISVYQSSLNDGDNIIEEPYSNQISNDEQSYEDKNLRVQEIVEQENQKDQISQSIDLIKVNKMRHFKKEKKIRKEDQNQSTSRRIFKLKNKKLGKREQSENQYRSKSFRQLNKQISQYEAEAENINMRYFCNNQEGGSLQQIGSNQIQQIQEQNSLIVSKVLESNDIENQKDQQSQSIDFIRTKRVKQLKKKNIRKEDKNLSSSRRICKLKKRNQWDSKNQFENQRFQEPYNQLSEQISKYIAKSESQKNQPLLKREQL